MKSTRYLKSVQGSQQDGASSYFQWRLLIRWYHRNSITLRNLSVHHKIGQIWCVSINIWQNMMFSTKVNCGHNRVHRFALSGGKWTQKIVFVLMSSTSFQLPWSFLYHHRGSFASTELLLVIFLHATESTPLLHQMDVSLQPDYSGIMVSSYDKIFKSIKRTSSLKKFQHATPVVLVPHHHRLLAPRWSQTFSPTTAAWLVGVTPFSWRHQEYVFTRQYHCTCEYYST
jgi:hypothetical protein